jgi:hypothetical protein
MKLIEGNSPLLTRPGASGQLLAAAVAETATLAVA